jgi:hypothetical protein
MLSAAKHLAAPLPMEGDPSLRLRVTAKRDPSLRLKVTAKGDPSLRLRVTAKGGPYGSWADN